MCFINGQIRWINASRELASKEKGLGGETGLMGPCLMGWQHILHTGALGFAAEAVFLVLAKNTLKR
jgi:hypothetical protein